MNKYTYEDNWKFDTTSFELQRYQIEDPKLYQTVNLNCLKVGGKYRYCFTKGTYPECITVLSNVNEGNKLVITNHYVRNGKPWEIKKSELINPIKDIFYEKNYYSSREKYLQLKEGLELLPGKSLEPIFHFLFDDENVIKEICSYIPRFL